MYAINKKTNILSNITVYNTNWSRYKNANALYDFTFHSDKVNIVA